MHLTLSYMRILTMQPYRSEPEAIEIFGYASRGLPGIEIIGLEKLGREIKEKFLYISKIEQIKIPLRKYVLCVEQRQKLNKQHLDGQRWFELPLLILFLTIAGHLKITKLDDCLAIGKVLPNGKLICPSLPLNFLKSCPSGLKYLAPSEADIPSNLCLLPLETLLENKWDIVLDREGFC